MQTEETNQCKNCGYDLHGIPKGTLCPECGESGVRTHVESTSTDGKLIQLINANIAVQGLSPLPDLRKRFKYWMRLGGFFASVFFLLQLLVTFALIPIGVYRLAVFGLSFFWPYVVVGMLPSRVDASMPPMYTLIRKVVPYTQWCWAAGYGLWLLLHVPTEEGTLGGNLRFYPPILLFHAIAGIGLAGVAFWLHDLALRLDLHTAAKRFNIFALAIPTLGVLVFILPWKHVAAAPLGPSGLLFWSYIMAIMGPWLFIQTLYIRALFEMAMDSVWSLKYEHGLEGRQERISDKRKEYERKRGW